MAAPVGTMTRVDWLFEDPTPGLPPATQAQAATPPVGFIALAGVTALAALLLLPLSGLAVHLVGWVLGSLGTIGLLTAFSSADAKRAQSSLYASLAWTGQARLILGVLGVAAAAVHAYSIGTILSS